MRLSFRTLMLKSVLILVATSPFAAVAARADSMTIGLDDESYPPFYSKGADGKWVGWEIDVLDAVCSEAKMTCVRKDIAWDGLIPALQQKQIDMIWASLTINSKRMQVMNFTQFYYNAPVAMIGPKDDSAPVDCAKLDSFKGKTIGVQAATTNADFLKANAPPSVQAKDYDTLDNVLADLSNGRIDYAMENVSSFGSFLSKNPEYSIKTKCESNEILGYGQGGGLRKEDTVLRDRISAAILTISKNGMWDTITDKYPTIKGLISKP